MNEPKKEIVIDGKKIGQNWPVYFIADIAANHDGDLRRAKELIYRAAESGADAAKFQHFKAETIVSDFGFQALGEQKSHQATWKKTVFDVYRDASVKLEWTEELKAACLNAGITYFTTPYDLEIVDFMDIHVQAYKIGSGDITWLEMIKKIASKQKPYILATGASTMDEVHRAVNTGLSINTNLALLQCNTNYTNSLENFKYIQLRVLESYRVMYPNIVLGLSDHTPGHTTVLGAVSLGAKIIEKHFTDDRKRIGPDHAFSMDSISWKDMVDRTRELEDALGCGIKQVEKNEIETVILQRRSLRAKHFLPKGHTITTTDFVPLRPCPKGALLLSEIENAIGKKLRRDIPIGDTLRLGDFE